MQLDGNVVAALERLEANRDKGPHDLTIVYEAVRLNWLRRTNPPFDILAATQQQQQGRR